MALEHESNSPLAMAVRKAGSQSAFARKIGRAQSLVNDWLRDERPLPAEHVLLVEREYGISRHRLRPDIYPPEESPRGGGSDVEGRGSPAASGPPSDADEQTDAAA